MDHSKATASMNTRTPSTGPCRCAADGVSAPEENYCLAVSLAAAMNDATDKPPPLLLLSWPPAGTAGTTRVPSKGASQKTIVATNLPMPEAILDRNGLEKKKKRTRDRNSTATCRWLISRLFVTPNLPWHEKFVLACERRDAFVSESEAGNRRSFFSFLFLQISGMDLGRA